MWVYNVKTKPHGIDRGEEFIREGFICIGWPGIGDLTNVDREEIKERLRVEYNVMGQKLGNYVSSVNIFVNIMEEGDIVLLAQGDYVYFGELSEYIYIDTFDNQRDGMCHRRNVNWIKKEFKSNLSCNIKNLISSRNTISRAQREYTLEELGLDEFDLNISNNIDEGIRSLNEGSEIMEIENRDIENKNIIEKNIDVIGEITTDFLLKKARETLFEELNSSNPEVRIKAAMAILRMNNINKE